MSNDDVKALLAIKKTEEFIDYAEWLGRIPSAKSEIAYERRWAYWLIHMKQARRGKIYGSCVWRKGLESIIKSRGLADLFDVDTRKLHAFDLSFETISGLCVGEISDKKTIYNQTQRVCVSQIGGKLNIPVWDLIKAKRSDDYVDLESDFQGLIGTQIGDWIITGFIGLHGDENTEWFCMNVSNDDGSVARVTLPSFEKLNRFDLFSKGTTNYGPIDEGLGEGFKDMTAEQVGMWTVVSYEGKNKGNNGSMWFCLCGCGNFSRIAGGKLRSGDSLSCGCMKKFSHKQVNV